MSDTNAKAPAKKENLLLNIAFNIVVPSAILSYLSKDSLLGPKLGLVVALAFPIGYGLYDFATRRKANFIAILGFASILMTGGMGLLKLDGIWFAVKEAGIPLVIGAMLLISQKSKRPLVREFLYNEQVINVRRVDEALRSRGKLADFDRQLAHSSYILTGAFMLAATVNFTLARFLLKSPGGTPEFNAELGKLNFLCWPCSVLPCMLITMWALYRLLKNVEELSGLDFDELMNADEAPKKDGETAPKDEVKSGE